MSGLSKLVWGAALWAGATLAARRVAFAPPDPAVAARAHAAQHSGPWRHGFVEANGLRFHYAEMGSGPLVVLLHGFPQCWYQWRYMMPRLAEHMRVVALDMRGYNLSERPAGVRNYSMDKLTQDVVSFIEAMGEQQAHVVGHDWGGLVAWYLGMLHPEHVDRLAIINVAHPATFWREALRSSQLLRSYYVFFFQLPVFAEAALRMGIRSSFPSTAAVPGSFPGDALDVYQNCVSQPGAATAMIDYYRAYVRYGFRYARLITRPITRPTMLLWGLKDFAQVPGLSYDLDRWVPGIRVERAPDSGHWVPEEKPAWAADHLLDFLGQPPSW